MPARPRVYCASPLGFSDAGRLFLDTVVKPAFTAAGLEMIDPWVLTPAKDIQRVARMPASAKRQAAWAHMDQRIAANNESGLYGADGVFAVLDGVDVDSGTAAEIGFAAGLDIPILGYRGDFRLSSDNEGTAVNLQVAYWITNSGAAGGRGVIIRRQSQLLPALRALAKRIRVHQRVHR